MMQTALVSLYKNAIVLCVIYAMMLFDKFGEDKINLLTAIINT